MQGSDLGRLAECPMLDDAFGNWFAGFVAGEGCFLIPRQPSGGYACALIVKLRADDRPVLVEIRDRLGIGVIRHIPPRGTSNAVVEWKVMARAGCALLVDLLDRYDLRAKKDHDFFIWRAAVLDWLKVRPGQRHDWSRIARFRDDLHAQRAFGGPTLGVCFPVASQMALEEVG